MSNTDHLAVARTDRVHTPGPWTLIGEQGTAIWAGDEIIGSANGARSFHKIARANALMMASALELADAVEMLLDVLDELDGECDGVAEFQAPIRMARAIHAKATGAAS